MFDLDFCSPKEMTTVLGVIQTAAGLNLFVVVLKSRYVSDRLVSMSGCPGHSLNNGHYRV